MPSDYLKFLKVLCSLYDGENYVPESEIHKHWKDCPPRNAILHLGSGVYFEWNQSVTSPGYAPLPQAFALLDSTTKTTELTSIVQQLNDQLESERQDRLKSEATNAKFQWANLILVALTLLATLIFGMHSCSDSLSTSELQQSISAAASSALTQPS